MRMEPSVPNSSIRRLIEMYEKAVDTRVSTLTTSVAAHETVDSTLFVGLDIYAFRMISNDGRQLSQLHDEEMHLRKNSRMRVAHPATTRSMRFLSYARVRAAR